MSVATEPRFETLALDDAFVDNPNGERAHARIRADLGVRAFGVNANRAAAGKQVVGEHDELGPAADRHEELYVVIAGSATFTIDGEQVTAPSGTAILVQPEAKRGAVADEDGTVVLIAGGRAGEAYRTPPGGSLRGFYSLLEKQEWEGALAIARDAEAVYPGNPFILYNVACCEARLGGSDDAIEHLRESIGRHAPYAELARTDDDLASLRDDARFAELVA